MPSKHELSLKQDKLIDQGLLDLGGPAVLKRPPNMTNLEKIKKAMSPRSPRFSRLSITNQRKSFVESNDDPGKSNLHLEKNLDAC